VLGGEVNEDPFLRSFVFRRNNSEASVQLVASLEKAKLVEEGLLTRRPKGVGLFAKAQLVELLGVKSLRGDVFLDRFSYGGEHFVDSIEGWLGPWDVYSNSVL